MTSRFRIRVSDDEGRAKIILHDGETLLGVINMSWLTYERLASNVVQLLLGEARESIKQNLGNRLWQDAQRLSEESVELAKQKLAVMGWNQPKVEEYADMLARAFAQGIAAMLTEVVK